MKDIRHDPSTPASDEALLSWHAEAEFQAWRNALEAQLNNWSTAPERLKPALLLAGPDLTKAEGWLHSRRGDISRRQQAFIRASIQNHVAAAERQSEAEKRRYSSTLSWWVSFTATISATFLLLLAEFMLFNMWRAHREGQELAWIWQARPKPAEVPREMEPEPEPAPAAAAEPEPGDKPEITDATKTNFWRITPVFGTKPANSAGKPARPAGGPVARPAPPPVAVAPPSASPPVAPPLASAFELAGRADGALRSGDATVATLLALEALAAAGADADARETAMLVLYRGLSVRQPIAASSAGLRLRAVEIERGARSAMALGEDGSVRLWDLEAAREVLALEEASERAGGAAVSQDGVSLAIPAVGDEIRLWNAGTGRMSLSLRGHEAAIAGTAFSPDRSRIASASQDQTGRIWEVGTGRAQAVLKGHRGPLRSAAFSPDGQRLVTTAEDQTARIWSVGTGAELAVLRGHVGDVTGAAFSADGERVLTTSLDGTARLWEAGSGRTLAVVTGSQGPIDAAVLSATAARIATIAGGKAAVWDADGKLIATLAAGAGPLRTLAFSSDERMLLVTGWTGEVALHDAQTGQRLALLNDEREPVLAAAFSADGRSVVAVGAEHMRIAWPAIGAVEELAEAARGRLSRCLTDDERRQHLLAQASPAWCARFEPTAAEPAKAGAGTVADNIGRRDSPF